LTNLPIEATKLLTLTYKLLDSIKQYYTNWLVGNINQDLTGNIIEILEFIEEQLLLIKELIIYDNTK